MDWIVEPNIVEPSCIIRGCVLVICDPVLCSDRVDCPTGMPGICYCWGPYCGTLCQCNSPSGRHEPLKQNDI